MRITVEAINETFETGVRCTARKGDGYFYFAGGEAADWLDRTVNAHSLSRLSLEQWIAEFERLKKLNKDVLSVPAQKGSPEGTKPTAKRQGKKR